MADSSSQPTGSGSSSTIHGITESLRGLNQEYNDINSGAITRQKSTAHAGVSSRWRRSQTGLGKGAKEVDTMIHRYFSPALSLGITQEEATRPSKAGPTSPQGRETDEEASTRASASPICRSLDAEYMSPEHCQSILREVRVLREDANRMVACMGKATRSSAETRGSKRRAP
ncbi:unnamed protein product [Ostreobium quekettii]|uniref:Uncharacterized protein n=1 Tax=Ostreobium quekettii TaxID=121088 RepID=A0A8S1J6P2_9CHLO|nr:unnamed protein product [Ostreobium quekettii]|eukprot:evm.model.scf_220.4 EVM.evm.TU.scf_220.4   scf_220:58856-59916(+)